METETGIDHLFVLSRSGTGHVLRFNLSFDVLSRRPELEFWASIHNLKEFACVSHKQYVYIIGGYSVKLKRPVQNVKRYDIISKEWSDLTNMEMERRLCTAVLFNEEIIVCGGFKNTNKLLNSSEIFNISRNTWRKGPSFKKGICDFQMIAQNNSVIGFGGLKYSIYNKEFILSSSDEIFEYKNQYKEWMEMDENVPLILGKPVYSHTIVEIDSKIYIIGGRKTVVNFDGEISEIINTKVESFNMDDCQMNNLNKNSINDWISPWDRSIPSPCISRSGASAVVLGTDIYLFGGLSVSQPNGVLEVEKFSPKKNQWNIEFAIKHEVDLSTVSVVKVYGSRYRSIGILRPIEEPVIETADMEEEPEPMYRVGWVLW